MKALKIIGLGVLGVIILFVAILVWGAISAIPSVTANNKGVAALNSGDLTTALADFNEAIKSNPVPEPFFYTNRATVEIKQGDNAAAMADLNNAIQLDPKDDNAYESRGALKLNQGDLPGAIADL